MKRNRRITLMALALAVCFGLGEKAFTQSAKEAASAAQAFDKLKTLAGRWEATTDKGKGSATFQVVSGGTVLLERTDMPGEKEMITMYHLDGNRLLLTHYCEAGNQPRMQAKVSDDGKTFTFDFLDATNLANPSDGHMRKMVLTIQDKDHFTEQWFFNKNGKDDEHGVLHLTRKQ